MKKSVLLSVAFSTILLLVSTFINAQIRWGAVGGLNISKIKYEEVSIGTPSGTETYHPVLRGQIGAFANIDLGKKIFFEPKLLIL